MSETTSEVGVMAIEKSKGEIVSVILENTHTKEFRLVPISLYNGIYDPPISSLPILDKGDDRVWKLEPQGIPQLNSFLANYQFSGNISISQYRNTGYFLVILSGLRFYGTIDEIISKIEKEYNHLLKQTKIAPEASPDNNTNTPSPNDVNSTSTFSVSDPKR